MKEIPSPRSGFTLIELMIVVLIIIIVSGSAIAGYFAFTKRQAAADDGRNFVTELRKTQSMARNLVYPSSCVGLQSYTMRPSCTSGVNCRAVDIVANCTAGGDANGEILVKDNEEVLQTAYFTAESYVPITFAAGTGNISPTGTYVLYTDNTDQSNITIQLYGNGNIEYNETSALPTGDLITPTTTLTASITPTSTATPTPTSTLTPTPTPTPTMDIVPTVADITPIIITPTPTFIDITVECPLGQTCISTPTEESCTTMGGSLFHCYSGNCCLGVAM